MDAQKKLPFEFGAEFPEGPASVTLTFPSTIAISADNLSAFIAALGDLRARMKPSIAPAPPRKFVAIANSRHALLPDPAHGGVIFGFLHPGFGWLQFHVASEYVPPLIQQLSANVPPPPKVPGTSH